MTSPISSVGYTPYATAATGTVDNSTNAQTSSDASSAMLDPQAFLRLLVAQLQYQDPTSPADMSSFMTQTATLSQTQSITSMQTTLQSMLNMEQAQTATNLIGKTVTYVDASGNAASGVVSGAAALTTGAQVLIGNQPVAVGNVTGVTPS
jgi:flagellar basal-body rod modification protein FlgD